MATSTELGGELSAESLAQRLVHYEVVRQVGHGAMGIVYEARQSGLGRRVAIKILPPSMALRERTVKRFLREAEAMGRLNHPCVVDIFEVRSQDDLHYFSMKFVEGPPLDRVLKVGPLPVAEVISIGIDVADALAHAHGRGVLHRDVKPSNLLRDGQRVILTDFGLARPINAEEAGDMTESGDLVGTPLYMSPEQIRAESSQIDGRADIWGLGATLYELLTHKPPFQGPNAQAILHAILNKDAPRMAKLRDDVPRDLEAVVLKCLEKEPSRRYATAAALAEDLRAVQAGTAISARAPRFFDPVTRWVRRNPLQSSVVLALIAGLIGVYSLSWRSRKQLNERTGELKQSNAELKKTEDEKAESDHLRLLMNARYELAELRRDWDDAPSDEERSAVEARLSDLFEAFSLRDFPQINEEALGLYAHWMHERLGDRAHSQVLAMMETRLQGLEPGPSHALRATVLTGLEQYAQALVEHRSRARLDPSDPAPCLDAARILRTMAKRNAADYQGLRISPESRNFLSQALALVATGLELAVRAEDQDRYVSLLVERARCLIELGDTSAARESLSAAGSLDPARADVHALLKACDRVEGSGALADQDEQAPGMVAAPSTAQGAPARRPKSKGRFSAGDLVPSPRQLLQVPIPKYSEEAGRQLQSIVSGMQSLLRDTSQTDPASEAAAKASEPPGTVGPKLPQR